MTTLSIILTDISDADDRDTSLHKHCDRGFNSHPGLNMCICSSGVTGRRVGFKYQCGNTCGFESHLEHSSQEKRGFQRLSMVPKGVLCSLWENTCDISGCRVMANPPVLGTGSCRFKSCHSDYVQIVQMDRTNAF